MSHAISNEPVRFAAPTVASQLHSFGIAIENAFNATTKKIKEVVTSHIGQGVIGFGLGVGAHKIYEPLTERIIKALGLSAANLPNPFSGFGLGSKILLAPFICVIGPILEEKIFRGDLQDLLKDKLKSFYTNRGFSDSAANTAARVTSVFFSSIIFGVIHFSNALCFWCNPVLFLPQVIAATLMGFIFGFAKEFSGELSLPIGMHIGNNTLAWILM